MFPHQPYGLFLVFTLLITVSGESGTSGSVRCDTLGYPFGVSVESPIRFECSDTGFAKIGEFFVQEVTDTNIIVGIPPECDRDIGKIEQLFGESHAPSRIQNIILLQRCEKPSNSCIIRRKFIENRLHLSRCKNATNLSCFSSDGGGTADVMGLSEVRNRGECKIWFSSILTNSVSGDSDVSLEFERVMLVWWMKGGCSNTTIAENAHCTDVKLADGQVGHRFSCVEGFHGYGFAGGCRRAAEHRGFGGVKVVVLSAGIVFGALLMVVLVVVCVYIQKRSVSSTSMKRHLSEIASNSSVPFYTYKEIEKATGRFSDNNKLGTGAYGTVYAGKLPNHSWVAVKRLRRRDSKSIDQVINEIKLLSSVNHPNLVRLLGCCVADTEPILVYEFMPNGTLSQHLQRERGNAPLPWPLRLAIAAQTANAIAHLHSSVYPPIYHRDIKSTNILLDFDFNAKISDFGLSRLGMTEFDASHISTAPQGTPGYLDPQYHQDFQLSDKSDVYSFGVVLVEIISALKVIDFTRPFSEVNLAALAVDRIGQGRVEEIVDPCLKTETDRKMFVYVHNVAELAFRCLSFHRDTRPTMIEVAEELDRIRALYSNDIGAAKVERVNNQLPSQESSPLENNVSG